MGRIDQIQALVRYGLYYLTEHADDEAAIDGFDVYDVEHGILNGLPAGVIKDTDDSGDCDGARWLA